MIRHREVVGKGFEIQNDELFGPLCYITENERAHKKVRFEIIDGKNLSKGVEILLREEPEQYVFMIRFDKEKIYRGSQLIVKEKWGLIVAFIKTQISFIDPERLKSITVMLPKNSDKLNVRNKKVKLLISLFVLLLSEKYILFQKTNGFQALSKEDQILDVYNAKMALSNYLKKSLPSKVKLVNLTLGSGNAYDMDELGLLPTFNIIKKQLNVQMGLPDSKESLPDSALMKPRPSFKFNLNLEHSPVRKVTKRRTKVDVDELIKMFNIADEAPESDEEDQSSESSNPEKKQATPAPLITFNELVSAGEEENSQKNDGNKSVFSKRFITAGLPALENAGMELDDVSVPKNISSKRSIRSQRASTMVRKTKFFKMSGKRKGSQEDKFTNFDSALDLITKTGFTIQKTVQDLTRPSTVTLCKIANRLILATIKYQNLFLFADFRIDFFSIPQKSLENISQQTFKDINLKLCVWTSNQLVSSKVTEFSLSESVFTFFERFGQGNKATRAVAKLIFFNRSNDQDKIDLQRILQRFLSKSSLYFRVQW